MFNNWDIFKGYLDFELSSEQKRHLQKYYEILIVENSKYNLTRITDINDVFEKHFLDSLHFTSELKLNNEKIIDIGTGPGFPGLVLKIVFPNLDVTLLDSNLKKISFLNTVINELKLTNIRAIYKRAEELARVENEKYDFVVSRAVAYLDVILELSVRFAKVNGLVILLKGPKVEKELETLKNKEKKMNLNLIKKQHLPNTGFGERINLFYNKTDSTPNLYPRDFAKIIKESAKNGA